MDGIIEEGTIIDVTDCNVSNDQIKILKQFDNCNNVYVQDSNWFGGVWKLCDYLVVENWLDDFVQNIKSKNLSPFESFICAYHFATKLHYRFAPTGSSFQACRSYVDVLINKFCVCVGYGTILKRLCEKLGIQCAVQGCLAKDANGKVVNHANCLVLLIDKKYDICGLYYCDPRMDCADFQYKNAWNLNMLALPMTDINKILIKLWNDDTIIEMNDFQSIYYSRKPTQSDLEYFGKFFNITDAETIMKLKYCKQINLSQIKTALQNIGLDESQIDATIDNFKDRENLFMQKFDVSIKSADEWDKRLSFYEYIQNYISHKGRDKEICKLDCATFVYRLYYNFFGLDIIKGGYGKSWTGKIFTADLGNIPNVIDETSTLKRKINFIDTNCKIGDILFFHRQSKKENFVSDENYYPGHCGIYLGNHKYIDSRLTTRGGISIVDIENDNYMQFFVGFKNIISGLELDCEYTNY